MRKQIIFIACSSFNCKLIHTHCNNKVEDAEEIVQKSIEKCVEAKQELDEAIRIQSRIPEIQERIRT
jgi:hypothetical protein